MSTPGDDIQDRQFEGCGRCIYCGADGRTNKLHKEHIIPFALGGRTIIKNANCTECRRLTHEVDTHLARMVFGDFRIMRAFKRGTRNKGRPSWRRTSSWVALRNLTGSRSRTIHSVSRFLFGATQPLCKDYRQARTFEQPASQWPPAGNDRSALPCGTLRRAQKSPEPAPRSVRSTIACWRAPCRPAPCESRLTGSVDRIAEQPIERAYGLKFTPPRVRSVDEVQRLLRIPRRRRSSCTSIPRPHADA